MNRTKRIASVINTIGRLGYGSAVVVAGYRFAHKRGWLERLAPAAIKGDLFRRDIVIPQKPELAESLVQELCELRRGQLRLLGQDAAAVESPPDWLRNRLSGAVARGNRPWWQASDFDVALGDIKGVWELSRFDWVLAFARAAIAGDDGWLARLNDWSSDWLAYNPPYSGPNWMCGQETSLRLMQVLLAARLLGQDRVPAPGLIAFARIHLSRIALTRLYADAQDNNHATSEATALFAAGAWLASVSTGAVARDARRWSRIGRSWLERLAKRLILPDGGFSQYSVNYHRLALDTLSQAELWRQRLALDPFSTVYREKCAAMTRWFAALVNAQNGDAPVLGANDGAYAFRLTALGYRDHRPSVQLAAQLFCGARAYPAGAWDAALSWLDLPSVPVDMTLAGKRSHYFQPSGVVLLNPRPDGTGPYVFVRVPVARFRPSQADPLHLDFWTEDGRNLLRDGGTASYFDPEAIAYFGGIRSHNSIQFDGREPMSRLSRFLFADWIEGQAKPPLMADGVRWSGAYRDAFGASHRRDIIASGNDWLVEDHISGYRNNAVLRWRLMPGPVTLKGNRVIHPALSIAIEEDGPPPVLRLVEAREARAYGMETAIPCLEAEFAPGTKVIRSRIEVPAG